MNCKFYLLALMLCITSLALAQERKRSPRQLQKLRETVLQKPLFQNQQMANTDDIPQNQSQKVDIKNYYPEIQQSNTQKVYSIDREGHISEKIQQVDQIEIPEGGQVMIPLPEEMEFKDSVLQEGGYRQLKGLHFAVTAVVNDKQIVAQPVWLELQPLRYDAETQRFKGDFEFFMIDKSNASNQITFPQPISIKLSSSMIEQISPETIEFQTTLDFKESKLASQMVQDSASITVSSFSFAHTEYIPVTPSLELLSGAKQLDALGFERIPITVRLIGSSRNRSEYITFTANGGNATESAEVSYQKPTVIYFRSQGMHAATLTAYSSNYNSNTLNFQLELPWLFILATLAGGIIGSLPKLLKGHWSALVVSMLSAVFGGALYVIFHLDVPGLGVVIPYSEIGVFLVTGGIALGIVSIPGMK